MGKWKEQKTSEHTILCECGHPLISHAIGALQCYASTRRTERRKNQLGKYVKVKCCYTCYCKKFKLNSSTPPTLKHEIKNIQK